jgi:hypothetical protein
MDAQSGQNLMRAQMMATGRTVPQEDPGELPELFTASCVVVAEWDLQSVAERLRSLLSAEVRRLVNEADFQGMKMTEPLSERELVTIQQTMASGAMYSSSGRREAGTAPIASIQRHVR